MIPESSHDGNLKKKTKGKGKANFEKFKITRLKLILIKLGFKNYI